MRKPPTKEALAELARLADKLAAGRLERQAITRLLDGPDGTRNPLQRWYSAVRTDPAAQALASDLEETLGLLGRIAGASLAGSFGARVRRGRPTVTLEEIVRAGERLKVLADRLKGAADAKATKDEANVRARAYLTEHAPTRQVSARELQKAIGCSVGLVPKLPAWIAYRAELTKRQPAAAPRAVSLTDGVLCNEGREDEALEKLIAEQEEDARADLRQPRTRRRLRV